MPADLSRAAALTRDLVRCASVTPEEGGALALIEAVLKPYGFDVHRPVFSEAGSPDVENLHARLGTEGPVLVFAGHTDVVPAGDASAWSRPPFEGAIEDGVLWGRGACDMKAGVAAAIAAVLDHLDAGGRIPGSVVFLITGDEEGPAVNGTAKLLEWAAARGECFDGCILGEPTNPDAMGDMMKIGRRGSLSFDIEVEGVAGHVAYQHLAKNPIDGLMRLMAALKAAPLDHGTPHFLASNLEFTTIEVGNKARNVIPGAARVEGNIRFNDLWTSLTLGEELKRRLAGVNDAPSYRLVLHPSNAEAFLTAPGPFVELVSEAVRAVTGRRPELSTTGGTSDARFIQNYCPVIEFGVVGQTMHKIDEHVAIADIDTLTAIYRRAMERFFKL
ncbi:MAG: succinyl-diaminopimelate desuccinylase [Methylobacterium sp.]|nr:succinyl-diaminopimelate desuccinylase [Methylobacterium sp.]MCA3604688.1 succinyl-diaminopimelate desuccinylase [Methylobacterium sp.]MCA3616188.1 succinyl-diaminopimelate desuccinylase [Methylobacterium sp.]MCA3622769.1 succinyl-diaminopimelate desuccinylase [Methylobacterium sp.]MCA4911187.1 succinyl-diaminopimelate desuccinylase [Methylobacterium sp.]